MSCLTCLVFSCVYHFFLKQNLYKRYLFCMNKLYCCRNFFLTGWCHKRLKNTTDLLLFYRELFYGFSESGIAKILENETTGEISLGLKTCTTLIVNIFKKNFYFGKVYLMSIRFVEQLLLERPLYRCFLHNDHLPYFQ